LKFPIHQDVLETTIVPRERPASIDNVLIPATVVLVLNVLWNLTNRCVFVLQDSLETPTLPVNQLDVKVTQNAETKTSVLTENAFLCASYLTIVDKMPNAMPQATKLNVFVFLVMKGIHMLPAH
jgi:hypothetical protein